MKKVMLWTLMLVCSAVFLTAENVERIEIIGNKKISRDTILFYLKTRENAVFIEEKLREDLKTLYETGFFENIRLECENGATGKIVKITVNENRVISSVAYKISKKIKESDITAKLQENNISFMALSYYNPAKVKKAQKVIQAMLVEKGFHDGNVAIEEKINGSQVALTIVVDVGSKTRIGAVLFPGLDAKLVKPGFLRRGMKTNRVHDYLSSVASKDVFNREKIDEDLEEVRNRLQQKGYMEARVGTPEISSINKLTVWGKAQKMLKISIPVEMGPQYRLRNLNIEGNRMVRTDYIRSLFKLKNDDIYDIKKRNKAIEEMQKLYGRLGYFYFNVLPQENLDPVKKLVDLNVRIQENDRAYLGKLEFRGNTFTKDHVLRREWFLREGNVLDMTALESSIRRMKQLGIVTIDKMPDIKPDPQDPKLINITAEVKEMNRQQINFNVGYSGYQGGFISLGYSTQNFLGMGETFNASVLQGSRSREFQFGFTEPYLFNLPANFGFEVFKTEQNIPNFPRRKDMGFSLSSSWRFWRYWGGSLTYGYQNIEILPAEISDKSEIYYDPNSYYNSSLAFYQPGKRIISYITPTIQYTTVDSPIFPSSGFKFLLNYRYSGGFLGGNIYAHKYKVELAKFQPLWKRHVLGLHAVYMSMSLFGNKKWEDVPYYERYFLGGEQSIRGYEIMDIGPRDSEGNRLGGNKAFYINVEYSIPVSQQFSVVLFYDRGNVFAYGSKMDWRKAFSSAGLELRVFLPILGVPIRLILAYNNPRIYESDNKIQFRFAIGPSFN